MAQRVSMSSQLGTLISLFCWNNLSEQSVKQQIIQQQRCEISRGCWAAGTVQRSWAAALSAPQSLYGVFTGLQCVHVKLGNKWSLRADKSTLRMQTDVRLNYLQVWHCMFECPDRQQASVFKITPLLRPNPWKTTGLWLEGSFVVVVVLKDQNMHWLKAICDDCASSSQTKTEQKYRCKGSNDDEAVFLDISY